VHLKCGYKVWYLTVLETRVQYYVPTSRVKTSECQLKDPLRVTANLVRLPTSTCSNGWLRPYSTISFLRCLEPWVNDLSALGIAPSCPVDFSKLHFLLRNVFCDAAFFVAHTLFAGEETPAHG